MSSVQSGLLVEDLLQPCMEPSRIEACEGYQSEAVDCRITGDGLDRFSTSPSIAFWVVEGTEPS